MLFRFAGRAGVWLAVVLAIAVVAAPVRFGPISLSSLALLVALIVVLPRAAVRRLTSSEAALGQMHEESQRRTEAEQHERRELSAWVADQVAKDRLTGLLNRTTFLDQLGVILSRDRGSSRAVVVLDLAKFSSFNEAHGTAAADELLVTAAARLTSVLRPEDVVARIDGDVFGALLTVPRELVQQVVDRVQRAIGSPYSVGGAQYTMRAVCGVVTIDDNESVPATDVLRRAEIALQNAKATARPMVVFEPRLEDETRDRLRFYQDLSIALNNDDFTLAYQPVVHSSTGQVSGVEALMRWTHSTRGSVSPAEFIPMAEASGQIIDMGLWALRTACRQQRQWRTKHDLDVMMAVNLSARQISEPDVVDRIADVITRETADPRKVKLEITESLVVEDNPAAMEVLHHLRGLGVRLSIDDFGTGYASLSRLSKLPIDELKIDRYFVAGIGSEGPRETILAASIGMAHGLGLEVVAEGVETPEQLAYLQAHGCDYIQGFLYSPPVPADGIPRFARQRVMIEFPVQRDEDTDAGPMIPAVLPSLERPLPRRLFVR
ncbi:MAG TPA: bifunctional diguanylate cyclase/phosphodiesterase [Mycobacteriales bacterium]|nr:bifunctional diguanylate cyclase/phosphodiesterase [Mycobacteriales bacterium]